MLVKISSLVVCLVLIQSTLNAAASGDPSRQRHPRASNIYDEDVYYEGSDVREDCHHTDPMADRWWTRNGKNITTGDGRAKLVIKNLTSEDGGIYTCNARLKSGGPTISKTIEIRVTVPKTTSVKVGGNVTLSCLVEKKSVENFAWQKVNVDRSKYPKSITTHNETHCFLNVNLVNVSRKDNGTYFCVKDIDRREIANRTDLLVLERPEIFDFDVRPVRTGKFRLNWTLFDGNSPVTEYTVFFRAEGDEHYGSPKKVNISNCNTCSFYLEPDTLEKHKSYQFKIFTRNSEGNSTTIESRVVNMSMIDPVDTIPMDFNTSKSDRSITINWSIKNLKPNSSYHYSINVNDFRKPGSVRAYNSTDKATRHVIEKLEPRTTYAIKVQGCIDDKGYTGNKCTEWTERNITTDESKDSSSSVSRSTEEFCLITLTTIVSMFLFKYDDVGSFLSF